MSPRSALSTVLALFAAVAISACGGSSSSSGNGVSAKSPNEILSAATKAINGVNSVHVSGSLLSSGSPISLDLNLVSGKGARGSMSEGGLSFQLVDVGGNVYINGSPTFWSHFGGSAAAQLFNGKWLKAPASNTNFASFAALTNLHQLLGAVLANHGTLAKGATTTVNGQKVVALKDTKMGGTLYVATTGKPYPVEISKSGSSGGRMDFDRINQPVALAPPPNAIDISKLHK